jgi:hypothetical protein
MSKGSRGGRRPRRRRLRPRWTAASPRRLPGPRWTAVTSSAPEQADFLGRWRQKGGEAKEGDMLHAHSGDGIHQHQRRFGAGDEIEG